MTETTDDPADRFEAIRRAMAVVAADRPTPEQITEWNAADRETAQRIRAALPGVPLHHAYAVLQALRVTQRLEAAAALPPAAVPSAPADRAALCDRIAEALLARVQERESNPELTTDPYADGWNECLADVRDAFHADAVLPAPADRAAVLEDAAVALEAQTCTCGCRRGAEFLRQRAAVIRASDGPSRMADEAQTLPQPEGPEYTPCACDHIEPEHEPNAGACWSCDCEGYRATPAAPLRRSWDDCPGFPEQCPNILPVDPNPPTHFGGIRCGCADQPAAVSQPGKEA